MATGTIHSREIKGGALVYQTDSGEIVIPLGMSVEAAAYDIADVRRRSLIQFEAERAISLLVPGQLANLVEVIAVHCTTQQEVIDYLNGMYGRGATVMPGV